MTNGTSTEEAGTSTEEAVDTCGYLLLATTDSLQTDQKRPEEFDNPPWSVGMQRLWDVTVVYSFAPGRIITVSVF